MERITAMYGINDLLLRAARFYPDRNALVDIHGEMTYRELNEKVNRIANGLLSLGYGKGDRIGFVCDNCNEFAEMWLATQRIGAVAIFLNYRTTKAELSRDIRRAECTALFYAPKWRETILAGNTSDTLIRHIFSFGYDIPKGHVCIDRLALEASSDEVHMDISPDDWSTVLFTSGSTGMSKGVVRTHGIMWNYAAQLAAENEFYKTDEIRLLSHSPLFHTGGLSMLIKTLMLGGTYIGVNSVEPAVIAALIEKYRVNELFMVPPVNIMRIAGDSSVRNYNLTSVRHIWATGGKLSKQYVDSMIELFPNAIIKTSYGGTEFCAACSMVLTPEQLKSDYDPKLLESAGYIGLMVDVKLVDDEGNTVANGQPGELWCRSPFVMLEYLNDKEETDKVLTDGWYHTGDVFKIDKEGRFFFLDRKSAMIKPGGENVYPAEVESVMRKHPNIVDCAIIGLSDPKWGEAVAAAIVCEHSVDMNDIISFAKENLAGFRKPLYYAVLSELPMTASGKIDRRALTDGERYTFKSIEEIQSGEK